MIVPGLGDLPCFPCALNKAPLIKAWPKNAQRVEPLHSWPLVGVPTGIASGFDVIDVDEEGLPWLEANLLQTRRHKTPHGWHLLVQPGDLSGSADDRIAHGVHIRANGNYVCWWPRQRNEVIDAPLAEWPTELLVKARGRPRPTRKLPSKSVSGHGEGHEEALAALLKLDPTDYQNHDDWLRVMMAAHAAGISFAAFVEWSTSDPAYADHAEIISRRWESLDPSGNANGRITGWALLVEARKAELERYFSNRITTAHDTNTWELPVTAENGITPTQNLKLRMNALMRMLERGGEPMLFRVACVVRKIIAEGTLHPRVGIELLRSACKINRLWWEDRGLCCRTIAAAFLTVEREGV